MPLVVDASVAVKFVVREHDTAKARQLLQIPDPLIAPDWLLVEAASAFWKKIERSELLLDHAERHLADLPLFFETLAPSTRVIADALGWSIKLRHSVYDCLYLALALGEDCKLVTADEKFHASLVNGGFGEKVELL